MRFIAPTNRRDSQHYTGKRECRLRVRSGQLAFMIASQKSPHKTERTFSAHLAAGQRNAHSCIRWQRCCPRVMPSRCSSIFTGRHIERHQVPTFYTERFEWHGDWPPEPSPPLAVIDDKLDFSGRSAY